MQRQLQQLFLSLADMQGIFTIDNMCTFGNWGILEHIKQIKNE